MNLFKSKDSSLNPANQTVFDFEPETVENVGDLRNLVSTYNHTAFMFKDGIRKGSNFLSSDAIIMDVDEGCSIVEFQEKFKGIQYYIATSKSHRIEKVGKPACDRFHVYFPLSRTYQKGEEEQYRKVMVLLTERYRFFDKNVKDLGRFIFRSGEAVQCFESSGVSIDTLLAGELLEQETAFEETGVQASTSDRQKLLAMLQEYAAKGGFDSYHDWIRAGGALRHEGFSTQDWASLSWPNAREECSKKWGTLPSNLLTMGTLIYYARKIDPNFTLLEGAVNDKNRNTLKVHKDDETMMKKKEFETVEECIEFFDVRFFKVILGNKTVVMERTGNINDNLKKTDFYDAHENKTVWVSSASGVKCLANAAKYWFAHTDESYKRVTFDPNPAYKPRRDEINTWTGFAFEPEKNGKADMFLRFIRDVICNGNHENYEYLLDLMAQTVREPHKKQGVGIAVALRGKQGVGKSFFVENFGKLFGDSFLEVDSVESITGRFNSNLMGKILVFGDEAIWGGDRANNNILKSLITSNEIRIERKFKDAFSTVNYSRFFFATNADWSAPVERGNRRYLVLDVSDKQVRDTGYFGAIQADLNNGGYSDLLYFLQHRDYSERDFQNTLPVTEASIDNLLNGLTPLESWLLRILTQGKLENEYDNGMGVFKSAVAVERVYKNYCDYVGSSGYRERIEVFGRRLKRIFSSLERKKVMGNADRQWSYVFPSLDKARGEFEEHLGFNLDWEEL